MKLWQILTLVAFVALALTVAACDGGSDGTENGNADVVAEDDAAQSLTGDATDDPDGSGCTNECEPIGTQQCVDGSNYQVCAPEGTCLAWGPAMPCQQGENCNAATGLCGSGECADECANVGVKTCTKEGDKVMECLVGQDGCKVLSVSATCAADETCDNGECKAGQAGTNDCIDIVKCSSTCQNQACVEQCASTATQAGIDAFIAMNQCGSANCSQYAQAPAALQKCLISTCGATWTACVGPWGTNTCMGMLQCAQGCGVNADCQLDCLLTGSEAAQIALWDVQACMEANCSQCGQDQTCLQTCAQQNCMNEYMTCQQG
jgi:hypothetical protein